MPFELSLAALLLVVSGPDLSREQEEVALIEEIDRVALPAREAGALVSLDQQLVREGAMVKAGDKLGLIDDSDAKAKEEIALREVDIAKANFDNKAEILVAKKSYDIAVQEYQGALETNQKSQGAISKTEVRRMKFQAEKAKAQIDDSKNKNGIHGLTEKAKQAQADAARNELERRWIRSPLEGIVIEVKKHQGEWVQAGETICTIVRMNRVRVAREFPGEQFTTADVLGKKAIATITMPDGSKESAEGVIGFASPILEPTTGRFRVWMEIENKRKDGHWIFRPGAKASLQLQSNRPALSISEEEEMPAPPRKRR